MKVGDTVYLVPIFDNKRRNKEINEGVISKIGRTYFYVNLGGTVLTFCRVNNLQKHSGFGYGRDWDLYFSMSELLCKREYSKLYKTIREAFDVWEVKEFTIEQLRNAATALGLLECEKEG